jgi:flagellin-like protein
MRKILCSRRAVSPLIATIILIAITVSGGLAVYSLFFSTAGTMSSQTSVQVVSCDLVKSSSKVLLSITVKNTGNKPITSCQVTVWDGAPTQRGPYNLQVGGSDVSSSNPLDPGAYASVTKTEADLGTNYIVGNKYPLEIVATASDGSTFDTSLTVTCSS